METSTKSAITGRQGEAVPFKRDETSCRNGAITGASAAVAEFGRVGRLGASPSFGLRRQARWLKAWRGGDAGNSSHRAPARPEDKPYQAGAVGTRGECMIEANCHNSRTAHANGRPLFGGALAQPACQGCFLRRIRCHRIGRAPDPGKTTAANKSSFRTGARKTPNWPKPPCPSSTKNEDERLLNGCDEHASVCPSCCE